MIGSSKYSKAKSSSVMAPTHLNSTNFSQQQQQLNTENSNNGISVNNSNGNVNFSGLFKEKIDNREKYLTAKYPNHQMALIKKRLKVEFWIDDKLKLLFQIKEDSVREDYEICPNDLVDTLLDIDSTRDG